MESTSRDIISQIVGEKYVDDWTELNSEVYYKNGSPYGLMAYKEIGDVLFIASTVKDKELPFTYNMIKKIKKLYSSRKICLITDALDKQEHIRNSFKRYNFRYEYDENGIMYSFNMEK